VEFKLGHYPWRSVTRRVFGVKAGCPGVDPHTSPRQESCDNLSTISALYVTLYARQGTLFNRWFLRREKQHGDEKLHRRVQAPWRGHRHMARLAGDERAVL
jgi:hypothetical protein